MMQVPRTCAPARKSSVVAYQLALIWQQDQDVQTLIMLDSSALTEDMVPISCPKINLRAEDQLFNLLPTHTY